MATHIQTNLPHMSHGSQQKTCVNFKRGCGGQDVPDKGPDGPFVQVQSLELRLKQWELLFNLLIKKCPFDHN